MKIAMLVPYFYPHTGGTEKYVRDLSVELAEKGYSRKLEEQADIFAHLYQLPGFRVCERARPERP